MQDKDLHTDKNFTDRAWKEMQFLLDKEMPVEEKNKKRPVLFWLSGISGIAALLAGIYFFSLSENTIDNSIGKNETWATVGDAMDNESSPMQKDKNILVNKTDENNSTLKSADDKSTNYNKINSRKTIEKSNSEIEHQQAIAIKKSILNSNKKLGLISKTNNQINPITTTDISKSATELPQNNIAENRPKKTIILETTIPPIHLNSINKIEQLTLQEIKRPNKINPISLKGTKLKNNHENTLFASNLFMVGSRSHGLSVGYLRNIKTINNNWNVNAGISYKYLAQPIEYTLTEASIDTSGLGSNEFKNDFLIEVGYGNTTTSRLLDNNGDPSENSNGSSDIPFNKLKMHYLTIPVNIQYRKNRFWLSGGIQASLLLVAKNSSLTGGIAKEIGLTSDSSEANFYNTINAGRTNPSIPDLSNFDFSTTLGIGYSLTKNLDMHFSYLHGLKDIIKNNLNKDYNRHFQFSMQYSW